MDISTSPIRMVENAEPKIAKSTRGDQYSNNQKNDQNINGSDDAPGETFADQMQKEPENDTRRTDDNRDRKDSSSQDTEKNDNSARDDKVEGGSSGEASRAGVDEKELVSNSDYVEAAAFVIRAETLRADAVGVVRPAEVRPIGEAASASLVKVVSPVSPQEKIMPTYQAVAGDKEVIRKTVAQISSPVLASASAAKQTSETVAAGITVIDPSLEVKPEKGRVALDPGEVDLVDEPEARVIKTAKPVTPQTVAVVPATFLLAEGEPELDLKTTPMIQETVATPKSALSAAAIGTSAVATLQTANAASASAAAQVVAAIKTEKNSGNIEVRLDPPELGRVRITFSMETADAVKAVLTVERSETLEYLRRNSSQFTEELMMAGFVSVDLEFSERSDSDFKEDYGAAEPDFDPSFIPVDSGNEIVYLSLRDDAQLNLLV
jgi:flagellar hook-length control protein FliK